MDGIYGTGTQSRVRSFQDDAGIGVDGKVGPQTWAKLAKYGKAVAWRVGFTLYLCKDSSTRFQYSVWNNSGREAWWRMFGTETYFDGYAIKDDRIEIQGTIIRSEPFDSEKFWVFHSTDEKYSTTNVRDFSSRTLPACG
ncbi:putative peptidoglycan binding protein [Kribbella sp. VKM Ac-2569]|nr:putative peptidoglycan binding protein [Kribbella sp. VKM Ac-2569]